MAVFLNIGVPINVASLRKEDDFLFEDKENSLRKIHNANGHQEF